MLAKWLVSLAHARPRVRRWLWRNWYQFLARRYPDAGWTFMNYGFVPPDPVGESERLRLTLRLTLRAEDERDRACIQLYDRVVGGRALGGRDVLEIGCGRGGGAAFVARHHRPRRLLGVDVSTRAVAFCRTRHSVPGLTFAQGDAEHLDLPAAAFDFVLNVESSHCYGDYGAFLAEARRVLRPGGELLHADFRPSADLAAWRAALGRSGLTLVCDEDLTPGVLAALEAEDATKRRLIDALIDRPLAGTFHEFAAVRGSTLYEEFRTGAMTYRAFVLRRDS
jgi:ubiquinone/menaquinone biosynthesis C-methylase UbiE